MIQYIQIFIKCCMDKSLFEHMGFFLSLKHEIVTCNEKVIIFVAKEVKYLSFKP
jgi:hypothetical protein